MTRLGAILIIAGLALALPQVFVVAPDQRIFMAGLAVAFIGGLLICDEEGTHGHD